MISDELLREAVKEYDSDMLSALPNEDECQHTFSTRFERKMKAVFRKDRHPYMVRTMRIAASLVAVLFLTGGSILLLSPTARAAVMSWIRGQTDGYYTYASTGDPVPDEKALQYSLEELPEGYSLMDAFMSPSSGMTVYANEAGNLLVLHFASNTGGGTMFLDPESAVKSTIALGDTTADVYIAQEEDESSAIVWVDPETNYLVMISGFFAEEALAEMAGSVQITEVPKEE